jgi:hypothetical protein
MCNKPFWFYAFAIYSIGTCFFLIISTQSLLSVIPCNHCLHDVVSDSNEKTCKEEDSLICQSVKDVFTTIDIYWINIVRNSCIERLKNTFVQHPLWINARNNQGTPLLMYALQKYGHHRWLGSLLLFLLDYNPRLTDVDTDGCSVLSLLDEYADGCADNQLRSVLSTFHD